MQTALTIAGSDSGGGAGIQADLKTFAALGVYGTSAITAVTAQNTLGVQAWQALPVNIVVAQITSVLDDIGADAVKVGMLANAGIIRAVAETIRDRQLLHVVVDPVMVAKGGARLIEDDAVQALQTLLFPLAEVVTPNVPEAEALTGRRIGSLDDMQDAARRILELGPRVVLVKGGHLEGPESIDVACSREEVVELHGRRIPTRSTHGTGCTMSSAIAAHLAQGLSVAAALQESRAYLEGALLNAPAIGTGHGPLNHMWRLY